MGGSILKTIKGISVGKEVIITKLASSCGKEGQSVRVGEACPHILVKEVIIGGILV